MIVEVDVPNAEDAYKAGMYASVNLAILSANDVLAVPLEALSSGDAPTVMVVGKDNAVEERNVTVGMRTASLAEIRSGLREGDLVVVGDRSGLSPGKVIVPKIVDLSVAE
jgi:multidrug efflux pump subunit AcrA (membrane-fusion protein)